MNKFILAAVLFVGSQLSACDEGCEVSAVSLFDVTEEQLIQIDQGLLALELPVGAVLFPDEDLTGEILNCLRCCDDGELEVIEPFYLRGAEGVLQFSKDLENWELCALEKCPE